MSRVRLAGILTRELSSGVDGETCRPWPRGHGWTIVVMKWFEELAQRVPAREILARQAVSNHPIRTACYPPARCLHERLGREDP